MAAGATGAARPQASNIERDVLFELGHTDAGLRRRDLVRESATTPEVCQNQMENARRGRRYDAVRERMHRACQHPGAVFVHLKLARSSGMECRASRDQAALSAAALAAAPHAQRRADHCPCSPQTGGSVAHDGQRARRPSSPIAAPAGPISGSSSA